MKTFLIALAGMLLAGCSSYAEKIIVQDATPGRISESLAGSPDALKKLGQISDARQIEGADKTPIDVWVIKASDAKGKLVASKGVMLIIHGTTESKTVFPFFGTGKRLSQMGYDVVLPDLRAHGRSGGKYITYGVKEKLDIKAVIDALTADKTISSGPIYVMGGTLGGTTAIQYAAIEPRVKGLMVIAPYKDIRSMGRKMIAIIAPTMSDKDFEATIKQAGDLGGFDPAQTSSVEAVKKVHAPILLVHGMLDLAVPLDQSESIFNAASEPKKLLVVNPVEWVAIGAIMENWLADRMIDVANGNIKNVQTQPTEK
jgi:alpha-beta hydrolase superfamily lysophospholipase